MPDDAVVPPRTVQLSGERTLVVRESELTDVDGLVALYERLDGDARHRRFFSMYRPGPEFVDHLVRARERGGASLVAEVTDVGGQATIVGEAEFELLPDGDGELAITVDAAWRGWLGPFLLDALIEAAAARGVPNLEADLLVSNGPMRALLRARGDVVMPHDDWSVLRVVIGTSGRVPSWPPRRAGLRVLVEGSGSGRRSREAAEMPGVEVLACAGPVGRPRPCPMLSGQPCPLAAAADLVVVSNPPDDVVWDAIRAGHAELHPGVPVCVELRGTSTRARPDELELDSDAELDSIVDLAASRRLRTPTAP
ncbi:MAG: GNAT family N-acetyltransferase [Actinobacteria bacterium]|nr:GNAT family N-acetyltransferase [Actinomycetota bacterium]